MTNTEIKKFANWYAYELYKFTFKGSRETEPTLEEYKIINKLKN